MTDQTMLDVWSMRFTKAELAATPERERLFNLMAGQLANELNILTKTLLVMHNGVGGDELQYRAQITQVLYFIRLLAGRLSQGWELIRDEFNPMFSAYKDGLSDDAKGKLKEIKKYFGRNNIIVSLRNKMVSHSDGVAYGRGFDALPADAELIDYVARDRGHCLYFASEFVGLMAMIELTGAADWMDGLDQVSQETVNMAGIMSDFILEAIGVFMNRHFKDHPSEQFRVTAGPPIDTLQLPFFAARPITPSLLSSVS